MKQLFLIRHAKSDWSNPELKDIERYLNERGYANANMMAAKFNNKPDLIISSPAIRAISTALIFARHLNYSANHICIKQELYESSLNDYLNVIHAIDTIYDTVFLFAHNPTISDVAQHLTQALPMELPTCGITGIRFNVRDWKNVKQGDLFLFDYPKKNDL
ncbi:MAG: histidine phosphatase family protein [Bacteroidetes bacterium]|nr:histidine phosphatase family protein [Bacteroidota bacterium]